MVDLYATDFTEIPAVLSRNAELRTAVERLIQSEPIPARRWKAPTVLVPLEAYFEN